MIRKPKHLLSAALAALIIGFAAAAVAGDVADIEIVSDQIAHAITVSLDDLAIGESRQLTASSGQPAIVTRTEDGLVVEVAGKRTEIAMPSEHHDMTWVDGGADSERRRVIVIDSDMEFTSDEGEHKVIMLKDGEARTLHGHEVEIITEDLVGLEGESDNERVVRLVTRKVADGDAVTGATKVTVTRRITSETDTQD